MATSSVAFIMVPVKNKKVAIKNIVAQLCRVLNVNPDLVDDTDKNSIYFHFDYNGETRKLALFPNFSSDYDSVCKGSKIIVSIGAWGSSKAIMHRVCSVLKTVGTTFYATHDWDGGSFKKLN